MRCSVPGFQPHLVDTGRGQLEQQRLSALAASPLLPAWVDGRADDHDRQHSQGGNGDCGVRARSASGS